MTTWFSKQKLAEAQEKKAKGGTVNGLLSKKKTSDVSKKDSVTKIPPACSPAKCLASPTSSLEMIAYGREERRLRRRKELVVNPSFLPFGMMLTQQLWGPMRCFLWTIWALWWRSHPVRWCCLTCKSLCRYVLLFVSFFFTFLLLRENFFVGFEGVPIHFWEALGFPKEGGHVWAFGQVFIRWEWDA